MYQSFRIIYYQDHNLDNISKETIEQYKLTKQTLKLNENFTENITNYLKNNDGNILVNDILKEMFPQINDVDIFLSHAHTDSDSIIKFSYFLEKKYNCNIFIDSLVWGNVFDLLKQIDNKYCLQDNGNYNYQKRNFVTSNLFFILSTALNKMIEYSDYFIFLETKQSTSTILTEQFLNSPWIFSELFFASNVKKTTQPKRNNLFNITHQISSERLAYDRDKLNFLYPIPPLDFTCTSEFFLNLKK